MTSQENDDVVRLVTVEGVLDVNLPAQEQRSLARDHFEAVWTYLTSGSKASVDSLAAFRDVQIAGLELESDPDVIDALDDSGELDIGELYPGRRADWR